MNLIIPTPKQKLFWRAGHLCAIAVPERELGGRFAALGFLPCMPAA